MDPVSVSYRNNNEIWVINQLSDSVSIVDLSKRLVTATLQTDDEPADVLFAGTPQRAYISCSQSDTVLVFNPDDITAPPFEFRSRARIPGHFAKALTAKVSMSLSLNLVTTLQSLRGAVVMT